MSSTLTTTTVHALRTVQCGDNNHGIFNESETLDFNPSKMAEFPCTSIIIRNSHIREISFSTDDPALVQNLEIRNVVVTFRIWLKLGFFADIQNNNESIPRQDSGSGDPTISSSILYDETKKPTFIMHNVTILGITRDPLTGNTFIQNTFGAFRPFTLLQIPIVDPTHLVDKNYNENGAWSLLENTAMISDPQQLSQSFIMNVLARNFLDLVLIENCDIRDSGDSPRSRGTSFSLIDHMFIGNQFVVKGTSFRGPFSLLLIQRHTVLSSGQYIVFNNTFVKDDENCADCTTPDRDINVGMKHLKFDDINRNHRNAIGLRIASKSHWAEIGVGVILEKNTFDTTKGKIVDEVSVIDVGYSNFGATFTQDDIDDTRRLDSIETENEYNNDDDDYYYSASVSPSSSSRTFLFHGFIFHRNVIRVSHEPSSSHRIGQLYPNISAVESVRFSSCLAVPRVVFLRNDVAMKRECRLWAFEFFRNVFVPGGVALVGNKMNLTVVSESSFTATAFALDGVGYYPEQKLFRDSSEDLIKNLPNSISSSSSSSSSATYHYDPRVISKIIVHANNISISGLSLFHIKSSENNLITPLLGIKLYDIANAQNISIRRNHLLEIMNYETNAHKAVSFLCGAGSYEGSHLENISSYEFVSNTVIGQGMATAAMAIGFENNHFSNVRTILVLDNFVDFSRLASVRPSVLDTTAVQAYYFLQSAASDAFSLDFYSQLLLAARSRIELFSVLIVDNSGPDLLRVHNNSFVVQLPTNPLSVSATAFVQIAGRGTASPYEQPAFAAQGFQPYNKKAQFIITHNNMRTARPSSVPESPELQQANNFAAFGRLGLLFFHQFFDETATFTSLTLEDNTLTSEFGGVLNILASVGSFHPTSFASIKNNHLFAKGIGNSSGWHLQVFETERSKKVELAALYMAPRILPVVHSLLAFLGYNNNVVGDNNFIVENNSLIVENGFGRVSGIETWACSEYEDQILPVSGTRRKCGFSGSIFFRNNIIRFSANPRSETKSSYLSLIDLGFGDALVDGRIQQLSFMENEIVYERTKESGENSGDQSCSLINSMPLNSSSGTSSAPSTLTFDNNIINFTNCKSSFFLGAVLPPRATLTNNNMTVISSPTSSTSSTFINIPSNKLPYNTETSFDNNRLVINYSSSDNANEVFTPTSSFIRQVDDISSASSSSTSSTSKLTFTSNHIDNILDQDLTFDASVRYAFDGKKSTSSSSFQFSLESHLPNGKGCNTIDIERATEINPDFQTAFNQQNMISSGQVTLLSSSSSSENFCNNFAGKNRADDDITNNATREISNTTMNETTTTAVPVDEEEEPNYSPLLQTANDAVGGLGIVVSSAAAGVVPSVGFGISRQQAMVGFIQNIYDGDCSGISVKDSIAAADSPTQLSIGNSDARFYIGGAVGNVIIMIAFCSVTQLCGTLFLKFTGSSSWNRPFSVFARCHVAMMGFICMSLLFAPTLKFGLVVATLPSVPLGEKILGVLFSIIFTATTIYYSYWSIFSRDRKEAYRMVRPLSKKEKEEQSFLARAFTFWFEGPGEWRMPLRNSKYGKGVTESDMLKFDAANPMLDGFQGHAYWFAVFEFCFVQFGLAFAEFLAQVVPSNKSCLTQGIVLLIVFSFYLLFCLWMRPFQELFNRIVTPLVTLFEIVVLALGFYFGVAGQQPGFIITLAMAAASMQSFVALVVFISSLSPIFKSLMKMYKRLKKKKVLGENIGRKRGVSTVETFRSALLATKHDDEGAHVKNLTPSRIETDHQHSAELHTHRRTGANSPEGRRNAHRHHRHHRQADDASRSNTGHRTPPPVSSSSHSPVVSQRNSRRTTPTTSSPPTSAFPIISSSSAIVAAARIGGRDPRSSSSRRNKELDRKLEYPRPSSSSSTRHHHHHHHHRSQKPPPTTVMGTSSSSLFSTTNRPPSSSSIAAAHNNGRDTIHSMAKTRTTATGEDKKTRRRRSELPSSSRPKSASKSSTLNNSNNNNNKRHQYHQDLL